MGQETSWAWVPEALSSVPPELRCTAAWGTPGRRVTAREIAAQPGRTRKGAAHAEAGGGIGDQPAQSSIAGALSALPSENDHAPASRSQKVERGVVLTL